MDVVINKRKIRDTVKQMVDNGRKNLKQENRNHPVHPVFQVPCPISNGVGWNSWMAAAPFMDVRQFWLFICPFRVFSFCRKSLFRLFYWLFPENFPAANSTDRNIRPVHKRNFLLLRYIIFFNDSFDFDWMSPERNERHLPSSHR